MTFLIGKSGISHAQDEGGNQSGSILSYPLTTDLLDEGGSGSTWTIDRDVAGGESRVTGINDSNQIYELNNFETSPRIGYRGVLVGEHSSNEYPNLGAPTTSNLILYMATTGLFSSPNIDAEDAFYYQNTTDNGEHYYEYPSVASGEVFTGYNDRPILFQCAVYSEGVNVAISVESLYAGSPPYLYAILDTTTGLIVEAGNRNTTGLDYNLETCVIPLDNGWYLFGIRFLDTNGDASYDCRARIHAVDDTTFSYAGTNDQKLHFYQLNFQSASGACFGILDDNDSNDYSDNMSLTLPVSATDSLASEGTYLFEYTPTVELQKFPDPSGEMPVSITFLGARVWEGEELIDFYNGLTNSGESKSLTFVKLTGGFPALVLSVDISFDTLLRPMLIGVRWTNGDTIQIGYKIEGGTWNWSDTGTTSDFKDIDFVEFIFDGNEFGSYVSGGFLKNFKWFDSSLTDEEIEEFEVTGSYVEQSYPYIDPMLPE